MTRVSENIPEFSVYFWFSEDFWKLLKMSEVVLTTFEHFQSFFKGSWLKDQEHIRDTIQEVLENRQMADTCVYNNCKHM